MLHNYVWNLKKHIFIYFFFNMDILLIFQCKSLEFSVHVNKTHIEGSVSQNFDIYHSFYFIVYRRWYFAKIWKKSQKLPVFCHKIKTKTLINNLRHASLDEDVFYKYTKSGIYKSYNKRDIDVQKIKVRKSLKNSPFS